MITRNFFKILPFLFILESYGQPVINEFMASNQSTLTDERGQYDDWIEIYNPTGATLSLQDFFLSDDFDEPTKWRLPNLDLTPGEFLIIWADGEPAQGTAHASFKLDADGEWIGLGDGESILDSLAYPAQESDVSFRRFPDGTGSWFQSDIPTPGDPNSGPAPTTLSLPVFSHESGFYDGPVPLQITAPHAGEIIRYTTDGAEPTERSPTLSTPITLPSTTVIRARVFRPDALLCPVETRVYFIRDRHNLAVMSLTTSPDNLWGDRGIYDNPLQSDWERPVHAILFDKNGVQLFALDAGIRLHGGSSKVYYPKKSFRLYFRNEYGRSTLVYPLFSPEKAIDEFKRIVLNAGGKDMPVSDEPVSWTLIRNSIAQNIGRRVEIPYIANRFAAVYLNGVPWGIYSLMERIDGHYIEENFRETEVDLIEKDQDGYFAREGDSVAWENMLRFFEESHPVADSFLAEAAEKIDLPEFTDYNLVEMYCGNSDWPINNQFMFKSHSEEGRWRWILWDMDRSLGYRSWAFHFNGLVYGTSEETINYEKARNKYSSSLILVKLLDNPEYRATFINRCADLLNTTLSNASVTALVDSLSETVRPGIAFEGASWKIDPYGWPNNIDALRNYALTRPGRMRNDFQEYFQIDGIYRLTVNVSSINSGTVNLNTLQINDFPWTGVYFQTVPIRIEAIPRPGYVFSHWLVGASPDSSDSLIISPTEDLAVTACFVEQTIFRDVIINEISYHPSPEADSGEWVELYNPSDQSINLNGWSLTDSNPENRFVFTRKDEIVPGGFLIVSGNVTAFQTTFPNAGPVTGELDFNLSNGGETIHLYDSFQDLIDSVAYGDRPPWPRAADGNGATLALMVPSKDNTNPEYWRPDLHGGSPGAANPVPRIQISSDTVKFTAEAGGAAPPNFCITITDSLGNALDWEAIPEEETAWLSLDPAQGSSSDSICLSASPLNFAPGFYRTTLRIQDSLADPPVKTVFVSLHLTVPPAMQLTPDTLRFAYGFAEPGLYSQQVVVTNAGGGWIDWRCEAPSLMEWVVLSDTSGSQGDTVTISINTSGLPSGDYPVSIPFLTVGQKSDTIQLFLDVHIGAGPPLRFHRTGADTLMIREFYADTLSVEGGCAPYQWYVSDALPPGLHFGQEVPIISGIPTEAGVFTSALRVLDSCFPGDSLTIEYRLCVVPSSHAGHSILPVSTNLRAVIPNPFNESTTILFDLTQIAQVRVEILNVLGQRVRLLQAGWRDPGTHRVEWNSADESGQSVPSGVYFCRLETNGKTFIRKLMLVR